MLLDFAYSIAVDISNKCMDPIEPKKNEPFLDVKLKIV